MIQEKLRQLLPEVEVDPRAISALLCGSATAILVLKWVGRRRIQEKMEEARRTRDLGLERMEQAAWKFKQKVTLYFYRPVASCHLENVQGGWPDLIPKTSVGKEQSATLPAEPP